MAMLAPPPPQPRPFSDVLAPERGELFEAMQHASARGPRTYIDWLIAWEARLHPPQQNVEPLPTYRGPLFE